MLPLKAGARRALLREDKKTGDPPAFPAIIFNRICLLRRCEVGIFLPRAEVSEPIGGSRTAGTHADVAHLTVLKRDCQFDDV